ncbi:MAG: hypothetical protein HY926_01250 [Elusimicrobia bacterium]|nr:hypothetical protein [Elusimicrobiota bacterium]
MNRRALLFSVPALILLSAAAHAGDAAPAAEGRPEVQAEAKLEVPSAPAEKPLQACAGKFQPVVDAYQQAHDGLLAWLKKASSRMEAVDAKIAELKAKVEPKSAKETEQRLTAMRKREPAPPQDPELQALLTDLKAQEARRKELCDVLAAAAAQKVQEFNQSVTDALAKASAESN